MKETFYSEYFGLRYFEGTLVLLYSLLFTDYTTDCISSVSFYLQHGPKDIHKYKGSRETSLPDLRRCEVPVTYVDYEPRTKGYSKRFVCLYICRGTFFYD